MARTLVIGKDINLASQVASILKEYECPAEVFSDSHLSCDELQAATIIVIGGRDFPSRFLRCLPTEREQRIAEITKRDIPLVPAYLEAADIIAVLPPKMTDKFEGADLAGLKAALSHKVGYVNKHEQQLRRQSKKSKKVARAAQRLEERRESYGLGRRGW